MISKILLWIINHIITGKQAPKLFERAMDEVEVSTDDNVCCETCHWNKEDPTNTGHVTPEACDKCKECAKENWLINWKRIN